MVYDWLTYTYMTIKMNAKCTDMFSASLIEDGKLIGRYYGYVPNFFPGDHYGDYVQLNIDVETGVIVNWKKPTRKELNETFEV